MIKNMELDEVREYKGKKYKKVGVIEQCKSCAFYPALSDDCSASEINLGFCGPKGVFVEVKEED